MCVCLYDVVTDFSDFYEIHSYAPGTPLLYLVALELGFSRIPENDEKLRYRTYSARKLEIAWSELRISDTLEQNWRV